MYGSVFEEEGKIFSRIDHRKKEYLLSEYGTKKKAKRAGREYIIAKSLEKKNNLYIKDEKKGIAYIQISENLAKIDIDKLDAITGKCWSLRKMRNGFHAQAHCEGTRVYMIEAIFGGKWDDYTFLDGDSLNYTVENVESTSKKAKITEISSDSDTYAFL